MCKAVARGAAARFFYQSLCFVLSAICISVAAWLSFSGASDNTASSSTMFLQDSIKASCDRILNNLKEVAETAHHVESSVHFCRMPTYRLDPEAWTMAFNGIAESSGIHSFGFVEQPSRVLGADDQPLRSLQADSKLSWQLTRSDAYDCDLCASPDDGCTPWPYVYMFSSPDVYPNVSAYCVGGDTGFVDWMSQPDYTWSIANASWLLTPLEQRLINETANPPPAEVFLPIYAQLSEGYLFTFAQSISCDFVFLPRARTYGFVFASQKLKQLSNVLKVSTYDYDGADQNGFIVVIAEFETRLIVAANIDGQAERLDDNGALQRITMSQAPNNVLRTLAVEVTSFEKHAVIDATHFIPGVTSAWHIGVSRYQRSGLNGSMSAADGAIDWLIVSATPKTNQIMGTFLFFVGCMGAVLISAHLAIWFTLQLPLSPATTRDDSLPLISMDDESINRVPLEGDAKDVL